LTRLDRRLHPRRTKMRMTGRKWTTKTRKWRTREVGETIRTTWTWTARNLVPELRRNVPERSRCAQGTHPAPETISSTTPFSELNSLYPSGMAGRHHHHHRLVVLPRARPPLVEAATLGKTPSRPLRREEGRRGEELRPPPRRIPHPRAAVRKEPGQRRPLLQQ